MSRKKHSIEGRVYKINDSLVSNDNFHKQNRRVVAVNNDKKSVNICKIKSLEDSSGNKRKNLVPIEKYPDIRKERGVHPYVFKKTRYGQPIEEQKLKKTKTRLNKWDMKKVKSAIK